MNYPKFIFIGTSEFAATILDDLVRKNLLPRLVITQPDKKIGRKKIVAPLPVKIVAQKNKINVSQPAKIIEAYEQISKIKPDLIIVAAYGQFLPGEILKLPKKGCLNIHASILPLYRGPSPIQESILKGDKKTGITIIKMDEKIDHGLILIQEKIIIKKNDTYEILSQKLAHTGSRFIIEAVPDYLDNKISLRTQDEKKATYAKIINKKDGRIDWQKKASEIERQIRAYIPWPSSYTFWQNKQLKILEAQIYSTNFNLEPGRVFKTESDEIAVSTQEKALIIKKLQLEGKSRAEASEFLKGYPNIIGSILN